MAGVFLALKLPSALAPIAAGERLLSLCAAVHILNSAPAESKVFRLLLLLIPWLGALIALFLPAECPRFPTLLTPFEGAVENMIACLAFGKATAGFASAARYFPTGKEMSEQLLFDLQSAKEEILLDYYLAAHGKFFDTVVQILVQKAAEGRRVKLVLDDFGCAALSRSFLRRLRARGVEAVRFHPLRPFAFSRLNRRDHRKLALIDRRIAYTGGINLADEYIGEKIRFGHWKDTAVRIEGEVCAGLASLFEPCPAKSKRKGAPMSAAEAAPAKGKKPSPPAGGIPCVPFSDQAAFGPRRGEEVIVRLLSCAKEHIELCTPYLIPTQRIISALTNAAGAGVRVRLMIPHIPDKKVIFALTRGAARTLTAWGVEVKEYAAGFLHAKSITADGKYALIGSYNLDRRSLRVQAECGVFLSDREITAHMQRDFEEMWKAGLPVKQDSFPQKALRALLLPFVPWV